MKVLNGGALFHTASSTTPSITGGASVTRPTVRFGRAPSCATTAGGADRQSEDYRGGATSHLTVR